MNSIEFVAAVQENFLKVFPNGFFIARPLPLGGDVGITMSLTRELADCPHNIRDNDRMMMTFAIHGMKFGDSDEYTDKLIMEPYRSVISTIPRKQYYAMGHDKIPTRKTTNTPEKLLATLNKYIRAAGKQVLDLKALNEIYQQENIKEQYFEINVK